MSCMVVPRVDAGLRGRAVNAATAGFWLTVLLVLLLDQGSKEWARQWLVSHGPLVTLIPGALSLTYVQNPGLAFGIFAGHGAVASVAAAAAGCLIAPWRDLVRLAHAPPQLGAAGFACLLGGALGNLLDRLFFGHVVDFIALRGGLVLNLADTAITFGVIALSIALLTE